MKATIIGAGFAGATVAWILKNEGWDVTVIEKAPHPGGGCWTYFYGGHPYTLGPRVYYGYSDRVWAFLNTYLSMRRFPFELLTYVEQERRFFSYPIHEDDIKHNSQRELIESELAKRDNTKEPHNFEEYWLQRVGRTLYDHFVNLYSKKMWMIDDNRIFDIFKWSAKDKPIETGTREAYKGSYIGYPVANDGYNSYFAKMLDGVDVRYNDEWRSGRHEHCDVVVSTMPIDEFNGYKFGELPYVGRDFTVFILPTRQAFPGDIRFCHYAGTEPHTRITEFKKITYHDSPVFFFIPSNTTHTRRVLFTETSILAILLSGNFS